MRTLILETENAKHAEIALDIVSAKMEHIEFILTIPHNAKCYWRLWALTTQQIDKCEKIVKDAIGKD